MLGNFFRRSND